MNRRHRPDDLDSLRKRLLKIIGEEIRYALRLGPTDLEAVYARVMERSSMLVERLQKPLAEAELRAMIQRKLKHTALRPDEILTKTEDRQMGLEGMEEFRGVPESVSYEDRPGHVAYIPYLDTLEFHRVAAALLLSMQMEADAKKYRALTAANDFAASLVALFGDLPLHELVSLWQAGRAEDRA